MTRDEIVTLLQYRCGDRNDLGPKILAEMKMVQTQILEEHPWLPWFCETSLTIPTALVSGTETLVLPTDFLREIEDERIWLVNSLGSKRELDKYASGQIRTRFALNGSPAAYALLASDILFRPIPEENYTIEWRYYGAQADMSATAGTTPWTQYASAVVIAEVGAVIAGRHILNPTLEAQFRNDATVAWDNLYKKHEARQDVNREPVLGG
ncbi:MAG TPA: hypothetical protein PKV55_07360 [Nitrospira sp.]|nr:hypothetical protein [Nitrospira sp.]HMZ98674.1 hypothetical protein [Nitrospira sp.]HNA48899.1 hypothetical protein [Nitrospira sp.]HNA86031.1 hypothetical protein [Nitrospira sp.]HNI67838.1 hypothetical protein [Nitrospira sp.]